MAHASAIVRLADGKLVGREAPAAAGLGVHVAGAPS
jgi:hypothetical protein